MYFGNGLDVVAHVKQEILATSAAPQPSISPKQAANTPSVCPELMGSQVDRTVSRSAVLRLATRGFDYASATDSGHESST